MFQACGLRLIRRGSRPLTSVASHQWDQRQTMGRVWDGVGRHRALRMTRLAEGSVDASLASQERPRRIDFDQGSARKSPLTSVGVHAGVRPVESSWRGRWVASCVLQQLAYLLETMCRQESTEGIAWQKRLCQRRHDAPNVLMWSARRERGTELVMVGVRRARRKSSPCVLPGSVTPEESRTSCGAPLRPGGSMGRLAGLWLCP